MDQDFTSAGMTRREALRAAGVAAAAGMLGMVAPAMAADEVESLIKNGRINQCICGGVLRGMKLEEYAPVIAKLGVKGVDLVGPNVWPTLKKYGLIGTMTPSHGLSKGLNRKENHEQCLAAIRKSIELTAEAGFPNVITFPGNRAGMDDETGARNMVEGLKQVAGLAEQKKVTLCIELLNSKVNHKDYMADRTAWGVAVCKAVGSERVKLLYDIYHMQVQEGDVIATIREYHPYIGHYHTAGVPGRNEIDDSQELYYPAIMKAILATGYKGYVSHEYGPKKDPMTSLKTALMICDI